MSNISEISGAIYIPTLSAEPAQSTANSQAEDFSDYFSDAMDKALEDSPVVTDPAQAEEAEDVIAETEADNITGALNDAVEEMLVNNILSSTSSMSGLDSSLSAYSSLSGLGIESMMLSSAASGEMSDTQLAMFMLCMLMNSAGEGSDTSMLSTAMFSLLSTMSESSEKQTSAAPGEAESKVVRGWDGIVRSTSLPNLSATGSAIVPVSAWIPTTPDTVSIEGSRSAENLRAVINQFDVEGSARYVPRNGATYCNIFVWDVTSALGCEVPHFVNPGTGEPRAYPDISGAVELDANGVHDWLETHGVEYGWREVSAQEAQQLANGGYPVVGAWKNSGGIGHVQMVCPSENGMYDASRGPTVAQAGSTVSNYTYQSSMYSSDRQQQVRYFVHA